ncbi:MAG: hypothetical protein AB1450_08405 [Pseudomonadota bacterium]
MIYALAINGRTATKAAIRRGSAKARRDMLRLDRQGAAELEALYRQARADIEAAIAGYADRTGTLRLEVLQQLLEDVNGRIDRLGQARNGLLDRDLLVAARGGVAPYAGTAWTGNLSTVADDVVRWVHSFTAADGLQLSDRLWRLDRGAKDELTQEIQSAVIQGHGASRAAQDFMARGLPVPPDVQGLIGMASAAAASKKAADLLLTGDGSAYDNALRVFRTEINRAHGEAYMASGEGHPDFAGWRFMLSPNHPRPDICDMHARANLYGLGAGVYPSREACPWPAHPNTISFVEIVFKDEISAADKQGKVDPIAWLADQSQDRQQSILGRQKAAALRAGILAKNEIKTPWKVLKKRYEQKGIKV